ncbi:hypothetical protein M9Y10_021517 [Tritrichomonas musculus]|uniref:Uncharacterized protein n=1 Tax=Tritrichomonas musculus TaxID=1915356 RepID=A0ABR2KRR8_9EUKA
MFWKPKTPKEKDLSDKMTKLKKATSSSQVALIYDLFQFVPEYTNIILAKLVSKFTDNLKNPITDKVTSATVDLICHMIEKSDILLQESKSSKEGTDQKVDGNTIDYLPYPPFLKQSKFIDYLFYLTANFDERVILMLEKFYAHDPLFFVKWILSQKRPEKSPLMLLFQLVVKTQNLRVGRLGHLLTVSRKDVTAYLTPTIIRPLLKQFPVSIVIDLMVASTEIRDIIPFADFEVWLLTHNHFTLSDIEIVTNFYKQLWLSETSMKLLLRSDVPTKMNEVKWISQREPQTNIDLSYELATQAIKQLKPDIKFTGPCDDCETTRDPYMFVRLFILSFTNPKKIGLDTHNLVIELIKDKNEFVSAAATQCIIYWMLHYDYQIKPSVVYRVSSAAVDEKTPECLRYLYMCALQVFGEKQDVASAILQAEENLRFSSKLRIKLCRSGWIFPHFKNNVQKILKIKLVDYNQAADLVSFITGYLCDANDDKIDQEEQINDNETEALNEM